MQKNSTELESVAKALIINDSDEALVLTVGEYKDHPNKSFKPDLPGGLVEKNESEIDAAVRETKEETGITLNKGEVSLVFTETKFYPTEKKSVSKSLYVSFLASTPEVTISWEHSSYKWVPLNRLLQTTELRPFYKEAIEYCFRNEIL